MINSRKTYQLVLRYSRVAPERLANAAARIECECDDLTIDFTISLRWKNKGLTLSDKPLFLNARPRSYCRQVSLNAAKVCLSDTFLATSSDR
jgi:hypothetical protein